VKFESFSTRDQKQNNNQIKEPRFSPFSFIFFYFLKNQIKFKHLKANKMSWIITDLIWNSHFQHSSTLKVKKRKFNSELNNLKREREREREKLLFTYLDKVYNGLCIESKPFSVKQINSELEGRSQEKASLNQEKKKWSWNNEKWSSLFL